MNILKSIVALYNYRAQSSPAGRFDIACEAGWTGKVRDFLTSADFSPHHLAYGMSRAVTGGQRDVIDLLRTAGAVIPPDDSLPLKAAKAGDLGMLRFLKAEGAVLSPALFGPAADNNDVPMLVYLADDQGLDICATLDDTSPTRYVDLAVLRAEESGKTQALSWLLDRGGDVCAYNGNALKTGLENGRFASLKTMLGHKNTDLPRALGIILKHAADHPETEKTLTAVLKMVAPKLSASPAPYRKTVADALRYAQEKNNAKCHSAESQNIVIIVFNTLHGIDKHLRHTPTATPAPAV